MGKTFHRLALRGRDFDAEDWWFRTQFDAEPVAEAEELTLTLDGKYLYTTLRKTNKIVVVRMSDEKIVTVIPQKGYPDLVTMEPTGRHALVTNRYADLVSVIDLATHTQVRTIPVGKAPHGMALRPR